MLICCWSSKGGAGVTVVAAALALVLAREHEAGALLVDVRGDVPAALGKADGPAPGGGLAGFLRPGGAAVDGLARCEVGVGPGLALVPRGEGVLASAGVDRLVALLTADPRAVVVDAGVLPAIGAAVSDDDEVAVGLAAAATRSLLVVRPCFLALRRALAARVRPSAAVLVSEDGRALGRPDVEQALGVPVLAEVPVTPEVARAVDAGILASRLPRTLARELRRAA